MQVLDSPSGLHVPHEHLVQGRNVGLAKSEEAIVFGADEFASPCDFLRSET